MLKSTLKLQKNCLKKFKHIKKNFKRHLLFFSELKKIVQKYLFWEVDFSFWQFFL